MISMFKGKALKALVIALLAIMVLSGCSFIGKKDDVRINDNGLKEYFSNINYIYNVYVGILQNNKEYQQGQDYLFSYDMDAKEYEELKNKYHIDEIAGDGTAFERAVRLMDEFAPRLTHDSNYENKVACNSLSLLDYSLDKPNFGINCLNKSKILEEMCLACGIQARRVWMMPYCANDGDNHVITEIYDNSYDKWIMLDMTSDIYFVDKDKKPLSLLEMREAYANNQFCTAISSNYEKTVEEAAKDYEYINTYMVKNLFYFIYESNNGYGIKDGETYYLLPKNFDARAWYISKYPEKSEYLKKREFKQISEDAVNAK